MKSFITIKRKKIGKDFPVFIIAEISANHGQKFNQAVALIKKAKACGVNAVKFQAYTPDTITLDVANSRFRIKHPAWGGQTLHQLYKKAYTPWKWFKKLKKIAEDLGLVFFATAFDKTAVDFLEELNVPIHKIASFELIDLPLIEYVARTRKPLILSTGMASVQEIKSALSVAMKAGTKDLILLKCVSSYPASPQEMNLRTIPDMQKKFKCIIGLSDHSQDAAISTTAVALGARVIEKHFTLSRKIKTPDSFFSTEPEELTRLVESIRISEKALGNIHYGLTMQEKSSKGFRRSLFVAKDIKKNELFSEDNVRSVRPDGGLRPRFLPAVIGRTAKQGIKKGTPLSWRLIR